jgi:hypothetical protein
MDDAGVFDDSVLADFDTAKVTSDYRAGPDAGVLTNFDIANNISRLTDEG